MATLKALIAERDALDKQLELAQTSAKSAAITQIRALMNEVSLTVADLSTPAPARKRIKAPTRKVAAKYRNTETGEAWSGRGLQPKWLKAAVAAGRNPGDFAV